MQPNACPFTNLPKNIIITAKLLAPAIITGTKKAIIGFSLISIPTFITYNGADSHKLAKGEEGLITFVSKALFSMNLVMNIGQEVAPILCGPYKEHCKTAARIGSYATQTWMFNQTAAAGIAKGISFEFLGSNYKAFIISETIGTVSNSIFSALYNHNSSKINGTEIYNNLVRDLTINNHVYTSFTCIFKPIMMGLEPNPFEKFLFAYHIAYINPDIVYNTSVNLIENAYEHFIGNYSLDPEL